MQARQIQPPRGAVFGKRSLRFIATALLAGIVATGCSSDDDDDDGTTGSGTDTTGGSGTDNGSNGNGTASGNVCRTPETGTMAWVATYATDYSSGRIDCIDVGETAEVTGNLPATGSDIRVETDGDAIFQLGRSNLDSLTRFAQDNPLQPVYQYSVLDASDENDGGNPYSLTFVSDTKAYLTRYNSKNLWIINPSADTEANFYLGSIDLSAYNDNVPHMNDAVLVGDKLFVLMERLKDFTPDKQAYLAVIDTNTDMEIDTGKGTADGLLGIPLGVQNPGAVHYVEALNELLVVGRGNYFADETVEADPYTGGLVSVDPDSYTTELIADDGTREENIGFYNSALVLDGQTGYLSTYESYGVSNLHTFNPTTGIVDDTPIAGLDNVDITTMAESPDGMIWLGVQNYAYTNAEGNAATGTGFITLNPADNALGSSVIATELVPQDIVFTTAE